MNSQVKTLKSFLYLIVLVFLILVMLPREQVDPNLYKAGARRVRDIHSNQVYYIASLSGNGPVLLGTVRHKMQKDALKQAVVWRQYLIVQYESELIALGSEVGQ